MSSYPPGHPYVYIPHPNGPAVVITQNDKRQPKVVTPVRPSRDQLAFLGPYLWGCCVGAIAMYLIS